MAPESQNNEARGDRMLRGNGWLTACDRFPQQRTCDTTIDELLQVVFSFGSALRQYNEDPMLFKL
jgi:hypothetical protein